jgi:1,2-diacylglycerol 3-alpha-glucosyltransferase
MLERTMPNSVRVCIFCHTVGPYHAARFAALARRRSDFIVIEIAAAFGLYPWRNAAESAGTTVETLFQERFEDVPPKIQVRRVQQILNRISPEIVVTVGYSEPAMRSVARWSKSHRRSCRVILVAEGTQRDRRRFFVLEFLKRLWCTWFYDAAFTGGVAGRDYFSRLGIPANRIWRGYDVIDNDHFAQGAARAREQAVHLRKELDLPGHYFLCVARYSQEKNLVKLIRAFSQYRSAGGEWDLVLVGSGPQEQELRDLATQAGGGIRLTGWQPYDLLPAYYGLATAFILPSVSEPWGLVVNEAMAAGLPVLISRICGCLPELCWRGLNGYDFDPYNVQEIAELMARFSSGALNLDEMSVASQRLVANFTPDSWAAALDDCISTLSGPRDNSEQR